LSETMATLRPTSAFTIDDLPTLGRPTTATSPLRWPINDERIRAGCLGRAIDAEIPRPERVR
jgi:hypothetical protein